MRSSQRSVSKNRPAISASILKKYLNAHISTSRPPIRRSRCPLTAGVIRDAHVSAGGVAPIPLYLKETSEFLRGKEVNDETIDRANEIMQSEISPISDVRGTESIQTPAVTTAFSCTFCGAVWRNPMMERLIKASRVSRSCAAPVTSSCPWMHL